MPAAWARVTTIVLLAWWGTTRSIAANIVGSRAGPGRDFSSAIICTRYRSTRERTSGPYTVMLLSNAGLGQMIEFTWPTGPLAYVWTTSTSGGRPSTVGAMTRAAAPSPKIIRDVLTLPILSENFSAHTS